MSDARKKNMTWLIKTLANGNTPTEDATLAVLMDIRDELQTLNRLLGCSRFTTIPDTLKEIATNTKHKPRKRKGAK